MLRRTLLVASLTLLAVPLAAQSPEGWSVRIDRSESATDPDDTPDLKFVTMGKGLHVTSGPAGTFWNPANTVKGNYGVSAIFTLMKPSGHTNYYGLVFGGSDLGGANQSYIYFMVAQDGTQIVRHRAGNEVHDIQKAAPNPNVRRPDATGRSTNILEVRVAPFNIFLMVNGEVSTTLPKTGMTAMTDGIVGIRVNHLLDVQVDAFTVTQRK